MLALGGGRGQEEESGGGSSSAPAPLPPKEAELNAAVLTMAPAAIRRRQPVVPGRRRPGQAPGAQGGVAKPVVAKPKAPPAAVPDKVRAVASPPYLWGWCVPAEARQGPRGVVAGGVEWRAPVLHGAGRMLRWFRQ